MLGLRPTELAVYEALVDSYQLGLAELCPAAGLAERAVRTALRSLTELGFVHQIDGLHTAVAPDVALAAYFLRREDDLRRERLLAGALQVRYERAAGVRAPADLVEVVHGADAISRRADQVMRTARHEVRFVDKPPYAKAPTSLHPVEEELLNRGVRFRGIYERRALELHDLRADLEMGLSLGEEARVVAVAPTKMILADSHLGLIPLYSTETTLESAVIVHRSALLDSLGALFAKLWADAVPLSLPGQPASSEVSIADARLLALLATGLPDRSIAKQLGLSYRTYQRRLHRLMDELGAQTRFQAGLRAAARGASSLLPPPQPPE
ncbi:Homeodomain-like domain-containing protein [Lentzea waywayandensis]|uniref:Homeodomain-like domain-containing protein n=1 Tax=Lentzea waywayandensis TaxID=84724 RepID=A0A1I6FF22_9PSEU|nr:helix-turn-helix domain-containing protein [Lentzea waywayandensis]SFR28357.1 Homeodomain-like domain-containing protein [Lentzea waywayandensis]